MCAVVGVVYSAGLRPSTEIRTTRRAALGCGAAERIAAAARTTNGTNRRALVTPREDIMRVMVEEHFATIAGRRVRYLETGSGWPVLLLHAFPMNADLWAPQLERAPTGFRFIAPDVMARPGAESMDEMAADLLRLAEHLEIERAVIGGISMGG